MASDQSRDSAFAKERTEVLKDRTSSQAGTRDEIVRLLQLGLDRIAGQLASNTTEWQAWALPRLQQDIERVMAEVNGQVTRTMISASDQSIQQGIDLVDQPLLAASIALPLQRVSVPQLEAMRLFMTDRIRDVTAEMVSAINTQLGLVLIGGQSSAQAVFNIREVLGEKINERASTIVRTELGRVFSVATNERLLQSAEYLPGLMKQWRRSGKVRSRIRHDLTDGQVQPLNKPFVIGLRKADPDNANVIGIRMMFPHDPKAPAGEVINCGCIVQPWMADWRMQYPGARPFSDEELRLNPNKRLFADAFNPPS